MSTASESMIDQIVQREMKNEKEGTIFPPPLQIQHCHHQVRFQIDCERAFPHQDGRMNAVHLYIFDLIEKNRG